MKQNAGDEVSSFTHSQPSCQAWRASAVASHGTHNKQCLNSVEQKRNDDITRTNAADMFERPVGRHEISTKRTPLGRPRNQPRKERPGANSKGEGRKKRTEEDDIRPGAISTFLFKRSVFFPPVGSLVY